jgi:hypothetical protein
MCKVSEVSCTGYYQVVTLRHWPPYSHQILYEMRRETNRYATGPCYPLGTKGTVPRAYDIFGAYGGMEGRKNKNKR